MGISGMNGMMANHRKIMKLITLAAKPTVVRLKQAAAGTGNLPLSLSLAVWMSGLSPIANHQSPLIRYLRL